MVYFAKRRQLLKSRSCYVTDFEDTAVEISGNNIVNGVDDKSNQCAVELDNSIDFTAVTSPSKVKANEKYLPLSVIEVSPFHRDVYVSGVYFKFDRYCNVGPRHFAV